MRCRNCGKENPQGARYCGYCQRELSRVKKLKANKKGRILVAVFAVVLVVVIGFMVYRNHVPVGTFDTTNTTHTHVWKAATCETPKTCEICGETSGLEFHVWLDATCLAPSTCRYCGLTSGTKGLHLWKDATADTPKTCSVCGETRDSALGNQQSIVENGVDVLEVALDDAIRERLPIATYAMTDEEKVYSYSDASLTQKTDWYYFYSRTNEIVIMDISEDGRALYVRYPSTITSTGYRECWFATEDILGLFTPSISTFVADTKIKTYKRFYGSLDVDLIFYDMVPAGTKVINLGEHTFDKLIIYPLLESENVLNVTVTERMALTSPYDQVKGISVNGYKTFSQYLEYDYSHLYPARILTKEWEDGGIKICFLNKRELFIKLKDSHMFNFPLTYNAVPLTKVNLFAGQDDHTGIEIVFSAENTLRHDEYFIDMAGKWNQSQSFASVQFDYSDGYITMYLALPEEMSWDLYSLTSISVETHLNEDDPEEHIVTQDMKATEIHCDSIRKIQSVQDYFSALDAQGNVLWTHVTQERQDRGQMSGIKYIGYVNNLVLYDDNNTIVALDAETGKQLWKRPDFEGIINAKDVGMDGTLYFAGSYAPDLFIVNENGTAIKKIVELDGIDDKYPYVNAINVYDDYVIVGVAEYWDGWVQKYRVDLDDYTCTIISESQT